MAFSVLVKTLSVKYWSHMWIRLIIVLNVCIFITVSGENRRPLFIVAHMVNSIYELAEYIERGANAIEADLTFHSNGTIKNIYHGYPCDCYRVCDERENFPTYLNHIKDMKNTNSIHYQESLTLLFLDLKLSEVSRSQKYAAGEEIAKHLISNLWNENLSNPCIYVLLSIGHTSDSETIRGVRDTFQKSHRGSAMRKLGFDVGLNDDLDNIRKMWTSLGVRANRWQGDGITNCLRMFRDIRRLRQAVRIRDSDDGYIDKAYDWTVDITANIRRSLRLGVDAILTNFPERIISVLQEDEFKDKYRLATADDNPFSKVIVAPMKSNVPGLSMNNYVSSVRELTIALMGYVWDFYKLRLKRPGTLFPLIEDFLGRSIMPILRRYRSILK